MEIMTQTILISAFISMIVSLVTTFVLTGGNREVFNLFMGLCGFTIGFIYGMVWLFLTGGLTYTLVTLLGGIIITLVFTVIVFVRMPDVISVSTPKNETLSTIASIAAIILVIVLMFLSALPTTYATTVNTVQLSPTAVGRSSVQLEFDDAMENTWLTGTTSARTSLVTIGKRLSAINFPSLTTGPNEGNYLSVEITFSVTGGGNWEQPYVKLAIIADANNNGQPDSGEEIWSSQNSKFVTTSGTNWRSSVMWEGNTPKHQFIIASSGGSPLYIPLFHASITQWKDDNGQTFTNTPENYVPPVDQLSWELSANTLTLKEDISSWATVAVGQSTTIAGKIYCYAGSSGNHLLLIQAFDKRYQPNAYDMSQTPISQSILAFTIGGGVEPDHCSNGVMDEDETGVDCGGADCSPCGSEPLPPVVDITTNSWTTVGLLAIGSVGVYWVGRKWF